MMHTVDEAKKLECPLNAGLTFLRMIAHGVHKTSVGVKKDDFTCIADKCALWTWGPQNCKRCSEEFHDCNDDCNKFGCCGLIKQ